MVMLVATVQLLLLISPVRSKGRENAPSGDIGLNHVSNSDESDTSANTDGQPAAEPFAWADFTWLQGNRRVHKQVLDSRYFTGDITMDMNYNFNFHHPIDHTNSGSTATFRS